MSMNYTTRIQNSFLHDQAERIISWFYKLP
jgi:hypothetical protein